MNREKFHHAHTVLSVSIVFLVLLCLSHPVACQNAQNPEFNQAAAQVYSDLVNKNIANFTSVFKQEVSRELGFCITDTSVASPYIIMIIIIVIIHFYK